ncbi:hypothetical protein LZ554_002818 [Drepanopeziza brunnea f. sp. 'monogermtubi']|nr:hypothetical protein LZ554_002818 [Drepanopeziza brunnea f. sp. 'monogermtubi']
MYTWSILLQVTVKNLSSFRGHYIAPHSSCSRAHESGKVSVTWLASTDNLLPSFTIFSSKITATLCSRCTHSAVVVTRDES